MNIKFKDWQILFMCCLLFYIITMFNKCFICDAQSVLEAAMQMFDIFLNLKSLHDPKTKQHQYQSYNMIFCTLTLQIIGSVLKCKIKFKIWDYMYLNCTLLLCLCFYSLGNACPMSSSPHPVPACVWAGRPVLGWIRFDHLITCSATDSLSPASREKCLPRTDQSVWTT